MNLTELLAMPVIHLPSAHRMGVVCAFCADERVRRITHVVVVDDDNYCRELCYRMGDVRWGQEVALVCADPVEEMPCRIPFRSAIVDTDGVGYAYLKEVACDDKGHITEVVNTLDETLPRERLLRMGDVVLLRGKTRVVTARHQRLATDAMDDAEEEDAIEKEKTATQTGNDAFRSDPSLQEEGDGSLLRIAGDYTFLMGRTLKNDLTYLGEVVAAKGDIIAQDTVQRARDKGLLLTLTALSR